MNYLGALNQSKLENHLYDWQSTQAKRIVKCERSLKNDPTAAGYIKAQYHAKIVALDFTLSATLTTSTVFQAGKFTVSVPAWIVGKPLAFLVGCVSKKNFESLDSKLPTFTSMKRTAQKAYRAGLGALISFIAGLGKIVGCNGSTHWNIKHQYKRGNVSSGYGIWEYANQINKWSTATKKNTSQKV